jgi:hypothetical protein
MSDQRESVEAQLLTEVERIRGAVENVDMIVRLGGVVVLFAGLIALIVWVAHMLGHA